MIREDVAALKTAYELKAADDLLPAQRRNFLLVKEIEALEWAHDQHWEWLKAIAAQEFKSPQLKAMDGC